MLLTFILSDRGLHESVLLVTVRGGILHVPTSRSMSGHPTAGLARWTGPAIRRSAARGDLPEGGRGEGGCGCGSCIGGTSSTSPLSTAASGVVPCRLSPRGMRSFHRRVQEVWRLRVRVSSSTSRSAWSRPSSTSISPRRSPKRSELEEVPESRKVRKINGLPVCSMDIVGAVQADYDAPQSFGMSSSGMLGRSRMRCTPTRASR